MRKSYDAASILCWFALPAGSRCLTFAASPWQWGAKLTRTVRRRRMTGASMIYEHLRNVLLIYAYLKSRKLSQHEQSAGPIRWCSGLRCLRFTFLLLSPYVSHMSGFIELHCFTPPLDVRLSGAPAPSRVPSRPGRLHCQRPPSPSAVCCDGGGRGIWGQQARRCLAMLGSSEFLILFVVFFFLSLRSMLIYNDLTSQRYWNIETEIYMRSIHIYQTISHPSLTEFWNVATERQTTGKHRVNHPGARRLHGGCTVVAQWTIDEPSMNNLISIPWGLWARVFRREGYLCCLAPEFHGQNTKNRLNCCELPDSLIMPIHLAQFIGERPWTRVLHLLPSYCCSDV